jgi:hypothetical protein
LSITIIPDCKCKPVVADLLAALKGVLLVADRQTVEFDAARAAIAKAEAHKFAREVLAKVAPC